MSNDPKLGTTSRRLIPDHGLRGGQLHASFKGYMPDGSHHAINDNTPYGHLTTAICGTTVYAWNTTYPSGGSATAAHRCDDCLEATRGL